MDTRIAKHKLKIVAVGTKKNVSDLCKKPVNKGMCEKAKFLARRLRIVVSPTKNGLCTQEGYSECVHLTSI